jgi:hypothetical protein
MELELRKTTFDKNICKFNLSQNVRGLIHEKLNPHENITYTEFPDEQTK